MSKILFINDIQLWNYKIFDWKDKETGIPVYLSRFFSFMREVKKTAIDEKIDYVVFNGDLIEHPNAPPFLLNHLYTSLISLSNVVKEIYIVLGNHDTAYDWNIHDDMMDKNYISLMFRACHNITVIQVPSVVEVPDEDTMMTFIPYTRRKPSERVFKDLFDGIDTDNQFMILFAHIPIKDYQLEFTTSVETPDQSLSLEELGEMFDLSFFGHYHNTVKEDTRPPFFTIGAPYQNSFKDKYQDRYLGGVLETINRSVKLIPYKSEHELITLSGYPSELPSDDRHYYRVYYDPLLEVPTHRRNILPIPKVAEKEMSMTSIIKDDSEPLNLESYIKEHAKANPIGIPDDMLIATGLEIFNEALGIA